MRARNLWKLKSIDSVFEMEAIHGAVEKFLLHFDSDKRAPRFDRRDPRAAATHAGIENGFAEPRVQENQIA